MFVVPSATQHGSNRLVLIRYTVCSQGHLSIGRHTAGRNPAFKQIYELSPVHESLPSLADAALWPVALQTAFDRVQEPEGGAAVEDAMVE